jgi:hypothetical protein
MRRPGAVRQESVRRSRNLRVVVTFPSNAATEMNADERHDTRSDHDPEEMLGGFDVHVGKNINVKGSGCITPAGS